MEFKYFISLKEGYNPTMEEEKETEIELILTAKNRVTADRMIHAMLVGCTNIEEYDGVCINQQLEEN